MDDFDLNASLGFLLNKANAVVRGHFNDAIKREGLEASSEQWGILNIISTEPGLTQHEISERSLKDKTNITRTLDTLERNGMVIRVADPSDRRVARVYVTADGESLRKRLLPLALATNAKAQAALSEAERCGLMETLRKIIGDMKGGDV